MNNTTQHRTLVAVMILAILTILFLLVSGCGPAPSGSENILKKPKVFIISTFSGGVKVDETITSKVPAVRTEGFVSWIEEGGTYHSRAGVIVVDEYEWGSEKHAARQAESND